jgi:hypothetical protein
MLILILALSQRERGPNLTGPAQRTSINRCADEALQERELGHNEQEHRYRGEVVWCPFFFLSRWLYVYASAVAISIELFRPVSFFFLGVRDEGLGAREWSVVSGQWGGERGEKAAAFSHSLPFRGNAQLAWFVIAICLDSR